MKYLYFGFMPLWNCSRCYFLSCLLLAIALTILPSQNAGAQATVDSVRTPVPTKPERSDAREIAVRPVTIKPKAVTLQKSDPIPLQSNTTIPQDDSIVERAYSKAMQAYYYAMERKSIADAASLDSLNSYNIWALKNRKNVIEKQQVYAKITFVLVIIIVLSGLLFSALQFRNAVKNSAKKKGPVSDTTLKATLGGIEVSSSILGVIILTISIAFFYLYLTKVYPVVLVN